MPFAGNVGRLLLSALSALILVTASQAQDLSHDQAAIKGLMRKTWERPSAPLSVDPVVVVDDHAIAGWIQDDRGGRALLRRKHGAWNVVLCSGEQLSLSDTVTDTGASPELAGRLVASLRAAEQRLSPDQLAKLASFQGIVPMDAAAPHHGHK